MNLGPLPAGRQTLQLLDRSRVITHRLTLVTTDEAEVAVVFVDDAGGGGFALERVELGERREREPQSPERRYRVIKQFGVGIVTVAEVFFDAEEVLAACPKRYGERFVGLEVTEDVGPAEDEPLRAATGGGSEGP